MATRLRVSGQCTNCGRKISQFAGPGRSTVRVACPREGCGGVITAKTPESAPEPEQTEETPAAQPAKRKIVKASYGNARPGNSGSVPDVQPASQTARPAGPGDDDGKPRREQPAGEQATEAKPVVQAKAPERRSSAYGHLNYPY